MREQKVHLRLKGKPICGAKGKRNRLQFVDDRNEVTCGNCKRVVRT